MATGSRDVAARLAKQRTACLERLSALTHDFDAMVAASYDSNADDEHDPEGSTIAFERSQLATLIAQARERLDELDAARQRLADGSYHVCERCGGPIAEARLEARPVARTCVSCAGGTTSSPDGPPVSRG
jgi:DnaK suppressor protein